VRERLIKELEREISYYRQRQNQPELSDEQKEIAIRIVPALQVMLEHYNSPPPEVEVTFEDADIVPSHRNPVTKPRSKADRGAARTPGSCQGHADLQP
jgi:hypothetical protein